MAYSRTLCYAMSRTTDIHKAHIAQLLVDLRDARGWSQAEAARHLGKGSERGWQRWEAAEVLPKPRTRSELAALFEVDESEFYPPAPNRKADLGELQRAFADLAERMELVEGALAEASKPAGGEPYALAQAFSGFGNDDVPAQSQGAQGDAIDQSS
jgi:transcriptional regulator with XRE-family HTH domain